MSGRSASGPRDRARWVASTARRPRLWAPEWPRSWTRGWRSHARLPGIFYAGVLAQDDLRFALGAAMPRRINGNAVGCLDLPATTRAAARVPPHAPLPAFLTSLGMQSYT